MAGYGYTALCDEEELMTYTDQETGEVSQVWRPVPRDNIRCQAKIRGKGNPYKGNRCRKTVIKGGRVCKVHGGNLASVRKAAARRLALAALPASAELIYIALHKPGVQDKDRLRALIEILDRAGVAGKTTIELEVAPWQQILQQVYGSLPDVKKSGGSDEEDTAEEDDGELDAMGRTDDAEDNDDED